MSAGSASVRWMCWSTAVWCSRRAISRMKWLRSGAERSPIAVERRPSRHRATRRRTGYPAGSECWALANPASPYPADEQGAENGEDTSAEHTPSHKLENTRGGAVLLGLVLIGPILQRDRGGLVSQWGVGGEDVGAWIVLARALPRLFHHQQTAPHDVGEVPDVAGHSMKSNVSVADCKVFRMRVSSLVVPLSKAHSIVFTEHSAPD